MKRIFTFFCSIILYTASFAQIGGGWDWAFSTGGSSPVIKHLAFIADGEMVFVGSAPKAIKFGNTILTAPDVFGTSGTIVFLNKISATGEANVVKSYSNPNFIILCATSDSIGNFYIAGRISGSSTYPSTADFGNGITYTATANVAFVAKINANGNAQWVKPFTFGPTSGAVIDVQRIAVSKQGNIFITGFNYAIINAPIYKLDNNGNTIWFKNMMNNSASVNFQETEASLNDKFIDDNENVHLLCMTSNATLDFNGEIITAPSVTAGGVIYTYHISLDANGNKRFANAYRGSSINLCVDRVSGNCLMRWVQYQTNSGPFANLPIDIPGPIVNQYSGYVCIASNGNTLIKNAKLSLLNGLAIKFILLKPDGSLAIYNKVSVGDSYGIGTDYLYPADATKSAIGISETDTNWVLTKFIISGKSPQSIPQLLAIKGNEYVTVSSFGIFSTTELPTTQFGNTTLTGYNASTSFTPPYTGAPRTDIAFAKCKSVNFPIIESTTWLGLNPNWNDPNNWTNGVPTASLKAIFNSGSANYPSSFPTSPSSGTLQVNTGAAITLPTTLTLVGGVKNDGTIKINNAGFFQGFGCTEWKGNGSVEFLGTTAPSFFMSKPFTNAITLNSGFGTFYDMEINGVTFNTTSGTFNLNNKTLRITNTSPTSISGTSSSNYFYGGTLQRAINSTGVYEFPVGSFSNFQSATVNANGLMGVSTISATHTEGAITGTVPSTTFTGVAITSALNGGWFSINPNIQPTAGSYNITLKIKGSSNTVTNANRYAVIKRNNSTIAWAVNGAYVLATTDGTTVTSTINSLTSFSDFAIGIGASSLPVSLTGFAVKANNSKVDMSWQTITEINNKGFNILHSIDGTTFNSIGFVAGNGNSNTSSNYSYNHPFPVKGNNYYRLEQIDFDCKKTMSEIKMVAFNGKEKLVTVYPNPVVSSINFSKFFTAGSSIQIINSNGALIEQGFINGNSYKPRQLVTGMYKVVVIEKNGNSIFTNNILVQ